MRLIKLTHIWPDNTRSEMWLSVEHILWMSALNGSTIIALVGDSRVTVAEHPHDIIRMIVSDEPQDDDDAGESCYQ